jgi:hypothetical protein
MEALQKGAKMHLNRRSSSGMSRHASAKSCQEQYARKSDFRGRVTTVSERVFCGTFGPGATEILLVVFCPAKGSLRSGTQTARCHGFLLIGTMCSGLAQTRGGAVTIRTTTIGPIIALVAGILILLVPRVLNYVVAVYLILIGLIGLFGV